MSERMRKGDKGHYRPDTKSTKHAIVRARERNINVDEMLKQKSSSKGCLVTPMDNGKIITVYKKIEKLHGVKSIHGYGANIATNTGAYYQQQPKGKRSLTHEGFQNNTNNSTKNNYPNMENLLIKKEYDQSEKKEEYKYIKEKTLSIHMLQEKEKQEQEIDSDWEEAKINS